MDDVTRRSFLVKGSLGVAGVAAAGTVIGKVGSDAAKNDHTELSEHELASATAPMLVEIRDPKRAQVTLLVRDEEFTFTDHALVAKALRASR